MKYLIIVLTMLLFLNCEGLKKDYNPCKDRMNNAIKEMGQPDDITTYNSKGYNSESWWWYERGVNYTWKWGKYIMGCEKSTYTFDPIFKVPPSERDMILVSFEVSDNDCILCR